MTMKYRVASSAMVPKIVGTLSPAVSVLFARKMMNKEASRSYMGTQMGRVSAV